jgi:hypothetical protein
MNQILELILQMDKSTGLVRIAYKTFEKCDAEATDGHTIVTANLEDFPKNAAGNAAFGRIIRWWLEGGLEGTAPSSLADQQEWDEARQIIEMHAIGGDVDAQNALAGIYLEDALRNKNIEMLHLADKWFRRSAEGGNLKAASFVETVWPDIRLEYETRINT